MSPLEIIEDGRVVKRYSNDEGLNQNRWAGTFGCFSVQCVSSAICRGGAERQRVESPHPRQPKRVVTPVGNFPRIIRGFQETEKRPDGHHFHGWSLGVETTDRTFEVTPRGKKRTLRFTRE